MRLEKALTGSGSQDKISLFVCVCVCLISAVEAERSPVQLLKASFAFSYHSLWLASTDLQTALFTSLPCLDDHYFHISFILQLMTSEVSFSLECISGPEGGAGLEQGTRLSPGVGVGADVF